MAVPEGAGIDAMVSHLKNTYPTRTVVADRYYEGLIPGDPWPPPAEGA